MGRGVRAGFAAAMLSLGCQADDGGNGFDFSAGTSNTGIIPATGGTGGDATAGDEAPATGGTAEGSGDGSSGAASTTGDGGSEDTGPMVVPGEPCVGVDVVFVIDNSDTMIEEQTRLIGTVSTWINSLNTNIPTGTEGFHIGVITTDDSTFKSTDQLGEPCGPFASMAPWIELGETMPMELACAINQGVAGDPDERPIEMLLDALSDEKLAPGGVHDGFVREDALLLVVLLTDEEDDLEEVTQWGSPGDPGDWIADLAAVKGGYHQDVAVISLVGHDPPNACPPFQWDGMTGAEIATRLVEFTEGFPTGIVGDICALEYNSFLTTTITPIADACSNIAL